MIVCKTMFVCWKVNKLEYFMGVLIKNNEKSLLPKEINNFELHEIINKSSWKKGFLILFSFACFEMVIFKS